MTDRHQAQKRKFVVAVKPLYGLCTTAVCSVSGQSNKLITNNIYNNAVRVLYLHHTYTTTIVFTYIMIVEYNLYVS